MVYISTVSRQLNGESGINRVLETNSYREIRITHAPWAADRLSITGTPTV
jgi:hypothetical protein